MAKGAGIGGVTLGAFMIIGSFISGNVLLLVIGVIVVIVGAISAKK